MKFFLKMLLRRGFCISSEALSFLNENQHVVWAHSSDSTGPLILLLSSHRVPQVLQQNMYLGKWDL